MNQGLNPELLQCGEIHPENHMLNPQGTENNSEVDLPSPGSKDLLFGQHFASSKLRSLIPIGVLAIMAILPAIIAAQEGVLFNASLSPDLSRDVGYWLMLALMPIPVFVFFRSFVRRFPVAARDLRETGVVTLNDEQWVQLGKDLDRLFKHRIILIVPVVVGLAGIGIAIATFVLPMLGSWHYPSESYGISAASWSHHPAIFAVYYLLASVVLRVSAVCIAFRKLFSYEVRIYTLHPDGCGGLSPIGRMCMRLNVFVFIMGIVCSGGVLSNVSVMGMPWIHVNNWLIAVTYVMCSLIVFFVPYLPVCLAMRRAKRELIHAIHQEFREDYNEFMRAVEARSPEGSARFDRIDRMRRMGEIAQGMPIYPFNSKVISSFMASLITPIVVMVLGEGIVRSWFGQG